MDNVDLERAIKAPFKDKDWVSKTGLGLVWGLLGVTAPAVYGAMLEYIQRVANGNEELPDWSGFGGKWVKGFMLVVAAFIYTLPVWILFVVLALPGIIIAAGSNGNSGAGVLGGGMCLFGLIAVIYSVAIAILLYGATVNYALRGTFGSLFAFSEILTHVRDGSGYFMAWIWAIVVSFGAGIVTSILAATVIGYIAIPGVVYLEVMITAHLFGQWAARSYRLPSLQASGGGVYPPAAGVPGAYPPAPQAYAPTSPPASPAYQPATPSAQAQQPPVTPEAYPAPVAPVYPPSPQPVAPAPEAPVYMPAVPPIPDAAFQPPAGPPAPPEAPVDPAGPSSEPPLEP